MEKTFIFAGFGGQGMLLIGKFMAMACMLDGKHVSWLPSYGPEMRGGTANCSVIVSDEPVASPLVDKADVIVAMNRPSLDKFEDHVKPGGVLVINSSIIDRKAVRDDIQVVYCDANAIAESIGNPKGANVAILGAVLEKVPVTTVEQMTEAIRTSTRAEREAWIREARYNLFKLRSDQVTIDLLTDSGTGSMSDRQWAAMMTGDESYAGASSYFRLKETIESIFGMPYFLPTHQGRAAENVIFSALLKAGDIVPGNSHFDTTKGHIEFRRCHAVDCTIDDAADTQKELPFKGEMDIAKLEKLLRENPREKVPCVVLTITNNTAGGQPVSMRNIRETAEVCRRYGVPLLLDSARFAENAYFIKTREEGYADKTIKEIVREIYTYADIMTISAKKDGVVNMGGFVAMRSEELYRQAMTFSIMFEGYVTYGGMSGRDMDALAVGLDENTEYEQLDARIRQVKLLGDLLDEYGVPYQRPAGGHAIFVDAKKVLPNLPKEQFIAQTLAVELYLEAGIRGVEIGSILADRDPDTHENRYPRLELLRLAIPRRGYSDNHIRVIAAACRNIYERRAEITTGYRITFEAPILRHFTVELDKI
mgnify:FL=1